LKGKSERLAFFICRPSQPFSINLTENYDSDNSSERLPAIIEKIEEKDRMVTIRKVRSSDRESWKRMRKALWPECPENRHDLEIDQILSSNGIVLIAESSPSDLVGFAEISIRIDHVAGTTTTPILYLEGWYVDPAYRGQGIGKAIIGAAENYALRAGFTELASDAEINNHTGIEMHIRLGFREVERTVHFLKSLSRNNS
jgi:aminoglycoside 6'-N-acetyltransferase I